MLARGKIVIDGKGHIAGRLAAYIAKNLREGLEIVVVRAEGILFSTSIEKRVKIYKDMKNKRCLVNPKKGPFHYREPSKCFKRTVRGMLRYKTKKGTDDYSRLKVFDGIPIEYELTEKVVCTKALASVRLNPVTKRSALGDICARIGWTNQDILQKFEEQRLTRSKVAEQEKQLKESQKKSLLTSEGFQNDVRQALANIE
ncbi:large subunit ribosomal protein L13Ae [Nematocida sp. AWRm80]|nr:large subunit ribosomal protein L13Ae [Nematocida sp. AWRm80]